MSVKYGVPWPRKPRREPFTTWLLPWANRLCSYVGWSLYDLWSSSWKQFVRRAVSSAVARLFGTAGGLVEKLKAQNYRTHKVRKLRTIKHLGLVLSYYLRRDLIGVEWEVACRLGQFQTVLHFAVNYWRNVAQCMLVWILYWFCKRKDTAIKLMGELIATLCEDLKNHAFMHHIESNFNRKKKLSFHNY